jgi:eukaryotic-like serine/threonine-protein kinase
VSDARVAAHDITAQELLDRGAARVRGQSQQPPEIHATLAHTLGVVYRNLGDYRQAAALLTEAVTARANLPGELDLADSLYQLGSVDSENGNHWLADALLRRALAIRVKLLGPDHLAVADVLERLADNVGYRTPLHEAIDDRRQVLEIRRRHLPGDDPQLVSSIAGMAEIYSLAGYYDNAELLFDEGIAIRRGAPVAEQCHVGYARLLYELGLLRLREGHVRDAERYADTAIDCLERVLGPDHVTVVDVTALRILIWREQGRLAEAEDLARNSLSQRTALHGDDSPAVDNALHHLARVLAERGKLAEAAERETDALTRRRRAYGLDHASVAESLQDLGDIQLASGDARTAEASYRNALDIFRDTRGEDHPNVAEVMRSLAEALVAQGRLDEARPIAEAALALQRQRLRPEHPATASTLAVLGTIAAATSPATAEPLLREALAIRRAALPPDHLQIAAAESLLGECLARQHHAAEARPLLARGADALRAQLGGDHPLTRLAQERRRTAERWLAE